MRNLQLIAGTPAEMVTAQTDLIDWAADKKRQAEADQRDAEANIVTAKRNKWAVGPWKSRARTAKHRAFFYQKVSAALKAGYYIVPPFPVEVFAIRTTKAKPLKKGSERPWVFGGASAQTQAPEKLPAMHGRYVSPLPTVTEKKWTEEDPRTEKNVVKRWFTADEFLDVSFPFTLVKPQLLEKVTRAMALSIFDDLGALPATGRAGGDPMIVGRVHPPGNKPPLTFFVAWWLDTDEI